MSTEAVGYLWHLTPRGWVPGAPPPDRVETWLDTHTSSSTPTPRWRLEWASPKHTEADRKALRRKIRRPVPAYDDTSLISWAFPLP